MARKIDPKPEKRTGKHGDSWRVRFRHDGRQTSETFQTQRQAQDFADDLRRHGVPVAMRLYEDRLRARHVPTLDETFEGFIAWKAPRVRSDRTIRDYRSTWTRWISPELGSVPVTTVNAGQVQRWVDGMVEAACSPKSISGRHGLLHSVFKWAAGPARRIVEDNPCVGTDLPKAARKMPKGLMPAEWTALYGALVEIDRDAADLADFLLASGWRWSEATALSVGQVEDYGGVMRVNAGWVIRQNAAYVHERVEDVKGEGSLRRVKLDSEAAAIVRRRCFGKGPGELVFTTVEGYQWHYQNFRRRKWNPAVVAAGLEHRNPTPHWLRHTSVGWAIMNGAPLKALQSRTGHKHFSTTMDVYGLMVEDVEDDVLDRVAAMRTGRTITGEIAAD